MPPPDLSIPAGAGTQKGGFWEPGQWVRHPGQPDWGPGQVQSAIGSRVTVMFEHAGKVLVNTDQVALVSLGSGRP